MFNKSEFRKISLFLSLYVLIFVFSPFRSLYGATYYITANWEQSPDPDVKEYRLYKKVLGVKELIGIISHPNTSYGPFPITVPDGSYGSIPFIITAIDFAGLESAESEPAYFDYDERVYVQFENSHSIGSESFSPASIKVILSKASDQTITVNYLTRDETAKAENDYHSSTGSLIFPPGTTIQTINVPIINDTEIEMDEKFILELSNPVNAILGTITNHMYTIIDDDHAGTIQFSSPNYWVNEKEDNVSITVTRKNGKDGVVSVDYLTIDGTAKSGLNYISVKGTLIWNDGDDREKTFTIPILKDNKQKGKITANLILENVSGGATLGNPNVAILTINDGRRDASIFFDDFSTEKAWIGLQKNGWERKPDSSIDRMSSFINSEGDNFLFLNNYILGIDSGNEYPDDLSEKSVVSPPIDCSGRNRILLKFKRWLNIESSKFSRAQIYVSNDGVNWGEPIWENPPIDLMDNQWVPFVIDISDIAADQGTVYVKFTMGPTNSLRSFSGWNIDDFEITEEAIFPSEGTLGTKIAIYGSGFGLKRGKVFIGNSVTGNISLKINEWRDDFILCTLNKVLIPGIYDIIVQPVGPNGIPSIVYQESFVVRGAEIYSINRTEGTSYDQVTLTGKFFGTKRGTVYLEYEEEGIAKINPCKIIKWIMDSTTGDSEVVFEIPSMLPAVCDVILDPYESLEEVELEDKIMVKAPEIEDINPHSGMQGELVTISGKYFGSKKPTIYLGYTNEKEGKYRKTGCSLVSWSDDKIVFRIPNLPSGTYDIIVKNATSSDTRVNGLIISNSGL